ncbi:aromatic-L-amino-acid decarboxylase-like [Tubulanus polymorphus]|uniref:aromatic-L-amino-acid decarboxylase-like n=1 Tax=Tubulanus polymorphus TaxID=672921 RepID=UPI003DA28016
MNTEEFRQYGKEMVDYICDYMENIHTRRVTPDVQPGYLRQILPSRAPKKGEDWTEIMKDVERAIMPGITHWQHPRFHAYFPAGNAYPSMLGDMLSDAIGCVGFSWAASPACTELECLVLDWLGKMICLPPMFLHENGVGGGVIQGSASDCVLLALLAARHAALKNLNNQYPFVDDGILLSKLVAYCSVLAHSCVEKAGMIGLVKMRQLDTDDNYSLRGHRLVRAIEEDRKLGLIPFFVVSTIGTTACCSFDNLGEIGPICIKENIWLHVDGAYAGSALICPEFQPLLKGIEYASSINMNPNKWLLTNFDCSAFWVKDRDALTTALTVDPLYLQHHHGERAVDYRHWGIPLSRRFRALKLWFVIRNYGVEGLQNYIREHCRLAKRFEALVRTDKRFEVIGKVTMGLVCFRIKGSNSITQCLLRSVNDSGKIHVVPAQVNDVYFIRFAVCAQKATDDDITFAWDTIREEADSIIDQDSSEFEKGSLTEADDSVFSLSDDFDLNGKDFSEPNSPVMEPIRALQATSETNMAKLRRQAFLKMVSDPKCYNPTVLKRLAFQDRSRSLSYDCMGYSNRGRDAGTPL